MHDSSRGTFELNRTRGGWVSPFNVMPVRAFFNMVFLGFCLLVVRYADGETRDTSSELRTFALTLAIAPVVWFLLAQPPIRRGAAATIRFLLGLILVGGVIVYVMSGRDRWMTVMTIGVLIGPAVAFALAHGAVRRNREEVAESRHQELVAAARASEVTPAAKASDNPRRGSVRSRSRRSR